MKKNDFILFNNGVINFNKINIVLMEQIKDVFRKLCEHVELGKEDALYVRKWYLYNEKCSPISFINEDGNEVSIYHLYVNEQNELYFCTSFGIYDIDELSLYDLIKIVRQIEKIYIKN